jgi:hypothetical protein
VGATGSSKEAEAGAVPPKEGLGLDDNDHPTPRPEQNRSNEELQLVEDTESGALDAATKDVDLMAEHRVLDDELASRAPSVTNDSGKLASSPARVQGGPHPRSLAADPGGDPGDREQAHLSVGPRKE